LERRQNFDKSNSKHSICRDDYSVLTWQIKRLRALGTNIVLSVFGEQDNAALIAAEFLIRQQEARLTVNQPHSEIMTINQLAGHDKIEVSSGTYALIKKAVLASQQHFGFNALIGPLVKLWKIGFNGANVPTDYDIKSRLSLCNPDNIIMDDALHAVKLVNAGMELDLGGIAKGFIADQIKSLWSAYGVMAGIIDLGGNLLFVGESPRRADGQWTVGIQNPDKARNINIGTVIKPACAAVTSGIYERFLIRNGKKYHHLLDPQTGYPLQTQLAGVTVFTRDSLQGELEAKRLFFAGQPIPGWEKDTNNLGAVFVYQNGNTKTVTAPIY
jgi:thiamine biosynthesis lipoprotein